MQINLTVQTILVVVHTMQQIKMTLVHKIVIAGSVCPMEDGAIWAVANLVLILRHPIIQRRVLLLRLIPD